MTETKEKSSGSGKLCFGLMCNDTSLERWQSEAVEILRENNIELKLIILNDNEPKQISPVKKLFSYTYSKLFFGIYNRFFLRPLSKERIDISEQITGIKKIKCKTDHRSYSDRFYESDIKKIKTLKLDFILRFGFNIIRGDILTAAEYGIWSFHHDDENKYRGGPPGFWEIYKNDSVNGVILQKLTEKLDAGIVLKKAFYKTIKHSYSANIDQIYFESKKFPLQICNDILNGVHTKTLSHTKAKIYHVPGNLKMIIFLLKVFWNKISFHLRELFLIEDWNIAILKQPLENILNNNSFAKLKTPFISNNISSEELLYCPKGIKNTSKTNNEQLNIRWLEKPKNRIFSADPFIFTDKNKNSNLLFEDYDYHDRKGKISSVILDSNNKKSTIRLEEDFHLSFPFILNHKNTTYCIPESFEKKQLRLYKLNEATEKFTLSKVLLNNIAAVDPILFEYNDLWWLFFTKKDLPSVNLFAYYSKEFNGNFKSHKNNPVKSDIRSSRPAGAPFYYKNMFCRPVQDCAKTYGDKVHITKIEKLSPGEFSEKIIETIEPLKSSKFNKGIHTLNSNKKYTVIDGKRYIFNVENFTFQLKRKISKLLKSKSSDD